MAYAGIVGVPPIMGLYTIVPALVAYALLGTSRQLVVGPDTATGLISALTVAAVAVQSTAEYNALTSTLAVLIGLLFLLFGAMRMGWVAPRPKLKSQGVAVVCLVDFPSSGWGFASGRPQSMARNRKTMAANSKTALPATDKPSKPLRGRCAAGRALSKLVDVTTLRADND